jgi:valyl-tRNA synthetase
VEKKLANGQFVERAPEEVVEREREKARSFGEQLEKLRSKLAELSEGA